MRNETIPYYRRVHDRALRDALRAVGLDSVERVVIGALIAIAGAVALWYLVGTTVAGQSLGTKVVTACAILAVASRGWLEMRVA